MAQITFEKSAVPLSGIPASPAILSHPPKILSRFSRQQETPDSPGRFIAASVSLFTACKPAAWSVACSPDAATGHLKAVERSGIITVARGISRGIATACDKESALATSAHLRIADPCYRPSTTPKMKTVAERRTDSEAPQALFARLKRTRWEQSVYLKWINAQCSSMPAGAPHYLSGDEQGGAGAQARYSLTIPLCRKHHDKLHRNPRTCKNSYGSQPEIILNLPDRAFTPGVLAQSGWCDA